MQQDPTFRTARLRGHPPNRDALALYRSLFGDAGEAALDKDIEDWSRQGIAPWTLAHAGHDVGVGGFRIGVAEEGLEILFHFLPDVWGQGLASEFLDAALDHGRHVLQQNQFFGRVAADDLTSEKILAKAGFEDRGDVEDGQRLLCLG